MCSSDFVGSYSTFQALDLSSLNNNNNNIYKVPGMLSTDCKNQSLRDRVDYKCDCRLQSSEFREPDFFVVD